MRNSETEKILFLTHFYCLKKDEQTKNIQKRSKNNAKVSKNRMYNPAT